ncbi:MetQ/NlpA family ABC transporter substrate-binding protein [Enterococcus sp. RIT-PI-f]|uniref:MetQ/NlpA family ABC transporter substrate-binding protein n=1 Tax=Enterococcus sp. RIT-PI-f TaxID=1690244 RepID=UPI0006B9B731|nr:MetQ/NlpA family ABC transporter substrate-binding protein [Enterococcus sp. RIT-PI-f]KPG71318.1 amino acid ABC transporter substrate-binding protein [Enterococcus sp. RIT-PI-f]
MIGLKKLTVGLAVTAVLFTLAACGNGSTSETEASSTTAALEEKVVGVAPGPYGDMVTDVISPLLADKGYTLTTKVFNDYIQPNNALANGQIDANLFQHTAYLEKFSADNDLDLTALQKVPTLGMGIYSNKLSSLDDLADGATVSIANDASNLARTLQLLAANGLITIAEDIDETKATVTDIKDNPKNLTFKELDAAQLARSLDTVDVALVPGNFAWAASLDPADALALESLKEEYKNVFVVRTEDKDSDFAQAVTEVLESQDFKDAIADSAFKDFNQPDFWTE